LIFGHEFGHERRYCCVMASIATATQRPTKRRRGSVRPHYGQFQARVSAGLDPVTGERIILHETVATEREAEKR
jgi:hypothetical protein